MLNFALIFVQFRVSTTDSGVGNWQSTMTLHSQYGKHCH